MLDLMDLAHGCAVAVHRSRWYAGTSQCHGLAGDAEFLLDLAAITGEARYRGWAADLAASIVARHALHDGRMVVGDESGEDITADFNVGLAGVAAFLLLAAPRRASPLAARGTAGLNASGPPRRFP